MRRGHLRLSPSSSAERAATAGDNQFVHFLEGSVEEKTNPWAIGTATLANGAVPRSDCESGG
jgi:hypothetical protein